MENENVTGDNAMEKIQSFVKKADRLKEETEFLIQEAKALSSAGIKEAEGLMDYAKANWKSLMGLGAALGIGTAITRKARQLAGKKSGKKASAKSTAKKATSKMAAKKSTAKKATAKKPAAKKATAKKKTKK
jgi:hypothetical protein